MSLTKKKTKQMQKSKTEVRKKKIYMEPNMLQDPSPEGDVIEEGEVNKNFMLCILLPNFFKS